MLAKLKIVYQNKMYLFIANTVGIFLLMILFYGLLRRNESINMWYVNRLNDYAIILLKIAKHIIQQFGYEVVTYGKTIRIIDNFSTKGIFMDRGCMGRNVMLGYLGLILAYPGRNIHKLWYIPLGLMILVFVNAIRIAGLAIIADCCPQYSDINHYVVFKIAAWIVIFLLWVVWMNKFGTLKIKKNQQLKVPKK